jgi:TRAP-type C4-dicarboxylate transport system permease small subunit
VRYFEAFVNRISLLERNIGAVFLLGVMVIIVSNVIYRVFGGIIAGTYDLVEILIVPAVGFALVTVELAKRHTMVEIVVNYFPRKTRVWVELVMTLISLSFWSIVCWASYWITVEKMKMGERTETLGVSVIPFRWVWIFALSWLLVVIVLNIIKLKKAIEETK